MQPSHNGFVNKCKTKLARLDWNYVDYAIQFFVHTGLAGLLAQYAVIVWRKYEKYFRKLPFLRKPIGNLTSTTSVNITAATTLSTARISSYRLSLATRSTVIFKHQQQQQGANLPIGDVHNNGTSTTTTNHHRTSIDKRNNQFGQIFIDHIQLDAYLPLIVTFVLLICIIIYFYFYYSNRNKFGCEKKKRPTTTSTSASISSSS